MRHVVQRGIIGLALPVLALALQSVPLGAASPQTTPSANQALTFRAPLAPGFVLTSEPLPQPLWLPSTARAIRVQYLSTGPFGVPVVVSGAVFVPEGPTPADGWPILSWAHGTVGVADLCAPSAAGRSARDIAYLTGWLQAGYAIVATDYRGLGTFGRHPYIDGDAAARDVIDMVRAARRVEKSLSRTWFASGQSQGAHAAFFTAAIATHYAPELDFRGAIATAPPTQWRLTVTATDALNPAFPANVFAIDLFAGLETIHPFTFKASKLLTDLGRTIYNDALQSECFVATATRMAGLTNDAVFDIDAQKQEHLIKLLEQEDVPIAAYDRPIYIAQGTADRVVYPPATSLTADQLRAAGTDVTFQFYPGIDHNGLLAAALPDLLAWANAHHR